MAAFGLIGTAALILARLPVRSYLPTLMLPNTGNMGLPVVFFAYGDKGLALAIAFSTIITIGHFTIGLSLASVRASPTHLLKAPVLYTLLAALTFIATVLAPTRCLENHTD